MMTNEDRKAILDSIGMVKASESLAELQECSFAGGPDTEEGYRHYINSFCAYRNMCMLLGHGDNVSLDDFAAAVIKFADILRSVREAEQAIWDVDTVSDFLSLLDGE